MKARNDASGSAPRFDFIDVTLRDAHQCLWSTRMTTAIMTPILGAIDRAGYSFINILGGAVFDVCVRYLQENPWARMRMAARRLRRTPINVWMPLNAISVVEMPALVPTTVPAPVARFVIVHVVPGPHLEELTFTKPPLEELEALGLELDGDGAALPAPNLLQGDRWAVPSPSH